MKQTTNNMKYAINNMNIEIINRKYNIQHIIIAIYYMKIEI